MKSADHNALPANALQLVHIAKRRLRLDDADYRAILCRVAGVTSSKDLDRAGFIRLMDEFRRLGFESTAHAVGYGDREGMATTAQLARLRRLWSDFTGGAGTDITMGKWLKGKWGVEHPRFLTQPDAHRALGALANMVGRKQKKASA